MSIEKHTNDLHPYLFIGARGELNGLEFEVLGWGEVEYKLTYIVWPEDQHEVGQTFHTFEYYCLANNGEIWYFSISGNEIHVHREILDPDKFPKINTGGLTKLEGGNGVLIEHEGTRAMKDSWNYKNFEYIDYGSGETTTHSWDKFDNGEIEWFTTQQLSKGQLDKIFDKTIRLEAKTNPKLQKKIQAKKSWTQLLILSIIGFVAVSVLAFSMFIFSVATTKTLYDKTIDISSEQNSIIEFTDINLNTGNIKYEFKVEPPTNKGVNLNLSWLGENGQIINSDNVEFYRYNLQGQTGNSLTAGGDFVNKNDPRMDMVVVTVDDFETVQLATSSSSSSSSASQNTSQLPLSKTTPETEAATQIPVNLKIETYTSTYPNLLWSYFILFIIFIVSLSVRNGIVLRT